MLKGSLMVRVTLLFFMFFIVAAGFIHPDILPKKKEITKRFVYDPYDDFSRKIKIRKKTSRKRLRVNFPKAITNTKKSGQRNLSKHSSVTAKQQNRTLKERVTTGNRGYQLPKRTPSTLYVFVQAGKIVVSDSIPKNVQIKFLIK